MGDDPSAKLAELRTRTWTTAAEHAELNRLYDEALADLARSLRPLEAKQLAMKAGTTPNDRQSLKRKAERWKANFLAMPAMERAVVWETLREALAEGDQAGA